MSVSNSRVHEKTHCPALAVVAVVGSTAVDEAGIARAIVYPAQDLHSLVKGQMRSIRHLVQRRLLLMPCFACCFSRSLASIAPTSPLGGPCRLLL